MDNQEAPDPHAFPFGVFLLLIPLIVVAVLVTRVAILIIGVIVILKLIPKIIRWWYVG